MDNSRWKSCITEINGLCLADYEAAARSDLRKRRGVEVVVALMKTLEEYEGTPEVHRVPQDDGVDIPDEVLVNFLRVMDACRGRKILLHCHMGISRTPSFAIFWWMFEQLRQPCVRSADGRCMELLPCGHLPYMQRRLGLADMWSAYEDRIRKVRPWTNPHSALKTSCLLWLCRYLERHAQA